MLTSREVGALSEGAVREAVEVLGSAVVHDAGDSFVSDEEGTGERGRHIRLQIPRANMISCISGGR